MTTAPETEPVNEHYGVTDAVGEIFDPELHATKPNGEPALKTDGSFRKKRRDAGRRTSTPTSARTKTTAPPAGAPRALKEQHSKHVQGIKDALGVPLMIGTFVSPIDAYTLQDLVDPFANALATVAQDDPKLAAALDKAGGMGGWTSILAIFSLGVVQVMHNHDKVPEHIARMVGAKPKSETLALMNQRAAQMRAAQEAQQQMDAEDRAFHEEMASA